MYQYVTGKDLIDDIGKYDVILIGTNCYCTMNNGFQGKIRKKYNFVYDLNLSTKYGDKNKLGKRVTTKNTTPIFSLCFMTLGYSFRPDLIEDYVDYKALENCIKTANNEFQGLKVATTLMGIEEFDGNGKRWKIKKLLKENSNKINLYIYTTKQYKSIEERRVIFKKNAKICAGKPKKAEEIVNKQIEERSRLSSFEEPTGRKKRLKKEIKALLERNEED